MSESVSGPLGMVARDHVLPGPSLHGKLGGRVGAVSVGGSYAGCWGRGPACGVEGARAAWSPWRGTEPGLPESLVVGARWAGP